MKIKKKKELTKQPFSISRISQPKKIIFLGLLLLATLITLPFTIVLLIGLLPTLTLLITDPKNSQKLIIIGCFNMAGVFVYLLYVISNYADGNVFNIVHDIFNLIIMLGFAGLGLILYCELPNLFIFFSKISAQKRLANIDDKLKDLAEEWGQETIDNQAKGSFK